MNPGPPPGETRLEKTLPRLYRFHPRKIDLSLDRLELLLEKLGNPERQLPPVFHVAGTNGKGSVVATLRAILEAAGQKVHVYTSPHLVSFRERIRLAGELIAEDHLVEILGRIEEVNGDDPITFFEVTTAAAFAAFSETPADVCLLEVGLGGRFDATNLIEKPLVCIITPIGLDHAAFLGSDLKSVAGEKAGIAKAGVPLVAAAQQKEALEVIEKHQTLFLENRDWQVEGLEFTGFGKKITFPQPSLPGAHQVHNAGLAVAALFAQDKFKITQRAITEGLQKVHWPARFQKLNAGDFAVAFPQGADIWLDGGHNPLAGRALAEVLISTIDQARPLYLIVGMMEGKDAAGFLAPMTPLAEALYALPVPDKENCIPPEVLVKTAKTLGLKAHVAEDIHAALEEISKAGGARPQILITGSLYLAGQVLRDINFPIK